MRRDDRAKFPSKGLAGGNDGRPSRFVLVDRNGTERAMPSSGRFDLKAGEGFYLDKAGGGGYGEPRKRQRAAIARDIAEGYVTEAAAARDYDFHDAPAASEPIRQRTP